MFSFIFFDFFYKKLFKKNLKMDIFKMSKMDFLKKVFVQFFSFF